MTVQSRNERTEGRSKDDEMSCPSNAIESKSMLEKEGWSRGRKLSLYLTDKNFKIIMLA